MTDTQPDSLLLKLASGDPAAAEEVFRSYEPYLRMVVRRQLSQELRAKFDSIDVVQSVWVDVLSGFRQQRWSFQDANHLRAFLVKVTHNRFIDRLRQHATALERERVSVMLGIEGEVDDRADHPSEVAQANELWQQLQAICPPQHLEVLQRKRAGWSLDEIASSTGYHKSSVRRILYDLARRMAARGNRAGAEHAGEI